MAAFNLISVQSRVLSECALSALYDDRFVTSKFSAFARTATIDEVETLLANATAALRPLKRMLKGK